MKFDNLLSGRLIKRYKRFLVDVELEDGSVLTAHCPNTGSMRGCLGTGASVLLSLSGNAGRKYPYTLEMISVDGFWVGINTSRTNHLVREALENGVITELGRIDAIQAEVKVSDKSRLDFLLRQGETRVFMEVKNCTMAEGGIALFPDAVTQRGSKHLDELLALRKQGFGAVVFFCVQRMDGRSFAPAAHIDPHYAGTLQKVVAGGVKVLAYQAFVSPGEIRISHALPVHI